MDDLISRAALASKVEKARKAARTLTGMDFLMVIKDAPAVDAVPVVHGQWTYFNCVGIGRYQCNECLHWVDAGTDRNYCPNCGAKMDGERRDEDAAR